MSKPFRLLARLRKYSGQTDLAEWSSTEMMQNLKAIEDAFENIEKRIFYGPPILSQFFSQANNTIILNTTVNFQLSAENLVSYGFGTEVFEDTGSLFVNLDCQGDFIFNIVRKNLVSNEAKVVGQFRMSGTTFRPVYTFYIEILPPGRYSYYLEARQITSPALSLSRIRFFVKVG